MCIYMLSVRRVKDLSFTIPIKDSLCISLLRIIIFYPIFSVFFMLRHGGLNKQLPNGNIMNSMKAFEIKKINK